MSSRTSAFPRLMSVAVAAAALLFIHFIHFSRESLLAQDLQNFGHVIVFSMVAVAVHVAVRSGQGGGRAGWRSYGWSAAILVVLGFLSEALQFYSGRNVDADDFLRNCVGALVGLTAVALFARSPHDGRDGRRRVPFGVAVAVAAAGVLLVLTLIPLAKGLAVSRTRNAAFPDLLPKSEPFFDRYLAADSLLWIEHSVEPSHSPFVRCVLTDRLFPGLIVADPVEDWHSYRFLVLRYRLTGPKTWAFFLLLDLCDHAGTDSLFRQEVLLEAGENEVRVDLAPLQDSLGQRVRCVDRLYLKTAKVDTPITLDLFRLYLDP